MCQLSNIKQKKKSIPPYLLCLALALNNNLWGPQRRQTKLLSDQYSSIQLIFTHIVLCTEYLIYIWFNNNKVSIIEVHNNLPFKVSTKNPKTVSKTLCIFKNYTPTIVHSETRRSWFYILIGYNSITNDTKIKSMGCFKSFWKFLIW